MDVLVIGATGLVGSNVERIATNSGHEVSGTSFSTSIDRYVQLDKRDADDVTAIVEEQEPDAVVDTAAFHAADDCEHERETAFDTNAVGTRNVAAAADDVDAHFIYLSTDYVFAGDPVEAPYAEDSPVSPLNYYAQTKYVGEQAAKIPDEWTVLRPSVIYGLASDNFATWALDELEAGEQIEIVDDQISRPTYAPDLADAIVDVLENGLTGLFHATGPTSLSRYEFTVRLAGAYSYDTALVTPISTDELGQEAPRPTDGSLDSSRLYDALGREFDDPTTAASEMARRAAMDDE